MSVDDAPPSSLSRRLPGSTVLQMVPALVDEPAARAAVNVASALLRSGARAIVAGGAGMLVGQLQALGGEWLQFPTASVNPLKLRSNARALTELIARERIDIVHAYSGPAAWSARAAIEETGAWLVTSYAGAPAARSGRGGLYHGTLFRGHRILVDSAFAAELLLQRHEGLADRLLVIPRSFDTGRFDPSAVSAERIAALRQSWAIRSGWRVILIAGRLSPDTGIMSVIDAVRILINGGMRGVTFVIGGESRPNADDARAIAHRIEAQGVGGVIRRVGHCADMPAAYAAADFVILPTTEAATFDEIAVEAQAMGRPVIAFSVGVLPEIVLSPPQVPDDAHTGWLLEPCDPIPLARSVAGALALDPSVRHAIGARAQRHAERVYSPARVAAATLEAYASLLGGKR